MAVGFVGARKAQNADSSDKQVRGNAVPKLNGELLHQLRQAAGWTQDDVARVAGLSRRSVQFAEEGRSVGMKTVNQLAAAFQVRPPCILFAETNTKMEDLVRTPSGGYVQRGDNASILEAIPTVPLLDPEDYQSLYDEDNQLGRSYATFWTTVSNYLARYVNETKSYEGPKTLQLLIREAGPPPKTNDAAMEHLLDWPSVRGKQLTVEQRRMWKFVTSIYPPKENQQGDVWQFSTIKPVEVAEAFHWARRDLAKHWDKWHPRVGWEPIRERFMTRCDVVLLLAWLELALIQWTLMPGRHKQGLFTLAYAYWASVKPLDQTVKRNPKLKRSSK